MREMDFADDREGARGTINRWVEEQTRDKIKDLLQPKDLDGFTRLVLTNAIYFRGDWKHTFEKGRTHDSDFETAPGVRVKVRMMRHATIKLRTSKTEAWQLLELPYAGDRLAMVVMLPLKRCGLREAQSWLTSAELDLGLGRLREAELDVFLPRFRFQSRFELGRMLGDMGMPLAFSDAADFTGITPGGALHINEVIHGGSVEVDEVGTVAAAASAVSVATSANPEFRADHPFVLLIRDIQSGSVLFIGRVTCPE